MSPSVVERRPNPALVLALLLSSTASALAGTMTQGGFTGLAITPSAHLLDWGRAAFTYDNQLPGGSRTDGSNYVLGIGLLPFLEVSGRIAANRNPDNCFVSVCSGIRDLSASGKIGIPLDARGRFRVAVGAADIGGAATFFRTDYGVLTYAEGPFEGSVGFARRGLGRSPLHGPFASAAWRPLPWMQGQVEYTDGNAWAGVRLFAPGEWLPAGWSAHVGANARLTDTNLTQRNWITAGLSIPLDKVPTLPGQAPRTPVSPQAGTQQSSPVYEARVTPPAISSAPASAEAAGPSATSPTASPLGDDRLQALAAALKERGLEDIWVGRMADASLAVRVNNATYNWNSVDALGAALGVVARELGTSRVGYRLVLTQRQMPLVAATGQTECLSQWVRGANAGCTAVELSTPGTLALDSLHAGSDWIVRDLQPSWKTVRVTLSPVARTAIATEVGVLDYSAGLNVGMTWPLWDGASAEWRVQKELIRSNDFEPDGLYARSRLRGGIDRLVLTQTMRLPLERWLVPGDDLTARRWGLTSITAQGTVGRVGNHFDGAYGSVRWEPGEGRHRLTLQGGYFHNSEFRAVRGEPRTARPFLTTYRYTVAPTQTYIEGTAGQFMNNDWGMQLGLRQWFGDTAVQVYVRRTQFSSSASERTSAGIEISLPLSRRRDMNPEGIQLTGTPRFSQRVESVVGDTTNPVGFGHGQFPPVPSIETVHNFDRSSLVYFRNHLDRLRDAAR